MRSFTDGNGNDSSAATLAYLSDAVQLYLADLFLLGELEDPNAVFLTNWSSPLNWGPWGTFQPSALKRTGITSQVGLKVDSMTVTWSPPLTAFGTTIATANQYQKAQTGFYDNWNMRIWRAVMPTPGDCQSYGATPWFGGRVSSTEIGRQYIKFTIQSYLDVVNQQVPPNVIENTNTLAGYVGATPVLADSETNVPTFTVVAPSSATVILGDCIQPTAHKIYSAQKFNRGYMVFSSGSSLAGYWSPVGSNVEYTSGSSHYNQFTVYGAFPWPPQVGDQFYVSTQAPINQQDAAGLSNVYYGFPFVPQPETAA